MKLVKPFLLLLTGLFLLAGCGGQPAESKNASGRNVITCELPAGETIPMPTTYLYFEHNSTAGDTGIHGMFDSSSFAELCVYDPAGNQILAVKPQNQLLGLTMAGIFFESREPEHTEMSVAEHLQNFPEGEYTVRGVAYDGVGYHGTAVLTHNLPNPPQMIFPPEMANGEEIHTVVVTPADVVFSWQPVTETLLGEPVEIVGYEVIVRRLTPANPYGFAHANYDVLLLPTATRLSVPDEFWEAYTPYEWEVLALEASGNQTLVSGFFETSDLSASEGYDVEIDPADFVTMIDNPYMPLVPGTTRIYQGQTEDGLERVEVTVLKETRVVMGVTTTVVRDRAYLDGELIEDTFDWLAQDAAGNVWYFGEAVDNYEDGVLVDHHGSWEAGVDGALPGILMYAQPANHLNVPYRQEYYAGEAEDMAQVLSVNKTAVVPFGDFTHVLQTQDWTPLEPGVLEYKFYAQGIGVIKEVNPETGEGIELVEIVSE